MADFGAVDFDSRYDSMTDLKESESVGLSRNMLPPHETLRRNSDSSLSEMKGDEEITKKRITKKRKRLSFDEKVEVLPIPMRHEYSQTERARLWSSAMEIHENATRNTIEFASEG